MRKPTVSIVAGGEMTEEFLPDIVQSSVVIGVDAGAAWLLARDVIPAMAVGDFDSVSAQELARIKKHVDIVMQFPKRKDATDLELAVREAVLMRPMKVTIFGALGRRFDHSLAAVNMLMYLLSHNIMGEIVDKFNRITVVRRVARLNKNSSFPYVSILPIAGGATVSLSGFLYNITKKRISSDFTLTISNEIRKSGATISVHRGVVLVIRSKG